MRVSPVSNVATHHDASYCLSFHFHFEEHSRRRNIRWVGFPERLQKVGTNVFRNEI